MENQTILDKIYSSYNQFFDSEKKIATYLMNHPREVIDMTIAELAKKCDVSEASVSRFCKKIDMNGFHHLKISLAREVVEKDTTIPVSNDVSIDNIEQSLQNILSNKVAELTATVNMIDTNELYQIIEAIRQARVVQLVAVGNTIPVAIDGAYKFSEIGISAVSGTIWETQTALSLTLTKEDVLIVISNSGESSKIHAITKLASERGVTTIGITNNKNSAIGKECKFHLQTATREKLFLDEFYFSRISASTIIEILYLFLTIGQEDSYKQLSKNEELFSQEKI
ncbi:MurR/RpiR family transcriptional regulator [Enterococcus sp. AZ109]|uniref:MurR/RpiR family transcriptional regulator n=1 Tax=Enterococcus sp. AZ109 TaxID=2774634 RepID=UPI003F26AF44